MKYQSDYVNLLFQMKRYEEAESVLNDGLLAARQTNDAALQKRLLRSLSAVYNEWGKPEKAAEIQKLLSSLSPATRPSTTQAASAPASRPATISVK